MKYNRIEKECMNSVEQSKLENMLGEGETVLWSGKPVKSAFILNSITTLLPFVILWLAIDLFVIIQIVSTGLADQMLGFIIPFFILHLLPVWLWISKFITSFKRWENTEYAVTDKRILLRSGFIGVDYKNIFYKDIKNVTLKVGVIDKMLNVGDIHIQTNSAMGNYTQNGDIVYGNTISGGTGIYDIENPYETLNLIQKIILDIQTDMAYPNDLRPQENHGYNTKYKA